MSREYQNNIRKLSKKKMPTGYGAACRTVNLMGIKGKKDYSNLYQGDTLYNVNLKGQDLKGQDFYLFFESCFNFRRDAYGR